ncbi:helix-turn-helix domain-containing protein [Enterococcus ureasiticus]|uniref:XRE family transcriptional regulator n=1 Tax=Enterococcus ureasiticus TaxID=903984 RepID=A0A1E5GC67_9ENTE|nr:helix-turn-helix domain-containing protein [Enterococcus ureasiticus]OEG10304.1 XRE family transcriptional regulator [Enterococcus ureasiticus]
MELRNQLKKYRIKHEWTQKELAEKVNVSDKTISSWETGRTYPDVAMLITLSELFDITLDEFMRGDAKMIKRIDADLKLKKVYRYALIATITIFLGTIIFLNTYQYKNQWIDRFNPFMEMKIGYATLPTNVTYNGGKEYEESSKELQIPDPYKDIWVIDDPFGEGTRLDFKGGQSPEGKNYALVQHKGLYVRRISFVSWDSIPGMYRDIMHKEYEEAPSAEDEPTHH